MTLNARSDPETGPHLRGGKLERVVVLRKPFTPARLEKALAAVCPGGGSG